MILLLITASYFVHKYTNINIINTLWNMLKAKFYKDCADYTYKPSYSFDIYKIHKQCDINNIEFIQNKLNDKLAQIKGNSTYIINNINSNTKNIIMLIGANGAGKTTCCFKLCKLFSSIKSVVCTTDIYKNSVDTFKHMAYTQNVNIYENTENIKRSKALAMCYIKKFCQDTQYKLMILDTSGRNFENKNLYNEISSTILSIKQVDNITLTVIYTVNCLNTKHDNIPEYNGVILSHINEQYITSNILNILTIFNNKLFGINSTKESNIVLYDNKIINDYIIRKINAIQQNIEQNKHV